MHNVVISSAPAKYLTNLNVFSLISQILII